MGLYLSSGSQPILLVKEKWPQPQVAIDTGKAVTELQHTYFLVTSRIRGIEESKGKLA